MPQLTKRALPPSYATLQALAKEMLSYYMLYLGAAICALQSEGLLGREISSVFVEVCKTGVTLVLCVVIRQCIVS